ncbi:MAG: hypothetical protein GQ534_03895 [Candidatus Delongbacteria bacterium]|nr:hypothetical protein [Candidatus Delongbacteria bacterium]
MTTKHTLFILTSILILLLSSCSTHYLIERKDLEDNLYSLDGKVKYKDGSIGKVKDILEKSTPDTIPVVEKKNFRNLLRNKKYHVEETYKFINGRALQNVERITFKSRSRGFLEGLLFGAAIGVIWVANQQPSESLLAAYAALLKLGGSIIAGPIAGAIIGHETHYDFYEDKINYKYKELREKSSNVFKLGTGVQNQEDPIFGLFLGFGQTFGNGDIIFEVSALNTTIGDNESRVSLINDFEFLNLGLKYYADINSKNSFYIGSNVSYGITNFDDLSNVDLFNEFEYGENIGFRTSVSAGYDFILNNNRNFIDLTVNFPLQEGYATKRAPRTDDYVVEPDMITYTGGSYWFPTITLTLGFVN